MLIFTHLSKYAVGCYLRYGGFPRRTLLGSSVNKDCPPLALLGASLLVLCSISHTALEYRQGPRFMRGLERCSTCGTDESRSTDEEKKMRKLMMLAALLAMVALAAIPAIAQVSQES